ncbi:putative phage tail protein, partial [Rhodanobacter spathiphylli]|uniref:putative phage tail protein n=1 Tax=Rhodanobacter spathiphylli TaxID=347483 RepID=UPI0012FAFE69
LQWREKEFNITASSDETIEFRRDRLIERKSRKPPITLRSLRNRLNAYIGTTQAEIELVPGEYAFSISIPAVDGYKFRDIQRLVEELKPANMEYLQFPFSVERIRIKEESREIKIFYARAGLAIAGRTR